MASKITFSREWSSAIRELLIIVAGILIAFSLNSWWEGRNDKRNERLYLARLADDLRADTAAFAFQVRDAIEWGDSTRVLMNLLDGGQLNARERKVFLRNLNNVGRWNPTPISRRTYDDMVGTGNLNLLRDADLRAKIVEHYEGLEGIQDFLDQKRDEMWQGILQTAIEIIPFDFQDAIIGQVPLDQLPQVPESIISNYRAHPNIDLQLKQTMRAYLFFERWGKSEGALAAELLALVESAQ